MRLPVSRPMPRRSEKRVPKSRVVVVANGEMSIAHAIDKEPTKAYSSGDEPGKVSSFK